MNKFVDSNVIIFAFTNSSQKQECRSILNEENLVTNTLVLLESYAKITTINSEIYARAAVRNILSLANIKVMDFTNNLFFESIKRSQKHKLKISDLVHFTTALLHNCSEIVSYDRNFDGLDIKRAEP